MRMRKKEDGHTKTKTKKGENFQEESVYVYHIYNQTRTDGMHQIFAQFTMSC